MSFFGGHFFLNVNLHTTFPFSYPINLVIYQPNYLINLHPYLPTNNRPPSYLPTFYILIG
jgi:hypothetical protein